MKRRSYTNLCFLVAVIGLLLVPVFLTNLKSDQISIVENRKLAEPVSFSEGSSAFMESLNACANDRIGFREGMVKLYNELTVNILHFHHDQVIFGKEGWLFYDEDLKDYTGTNNTPENVEHCVQVIRRLDQWCKERGGQLVFIVGPNKSTVYSQYMPDYIHQTDISLLDSLSARLLMEDIVFINPKDRMIVDSSDTELYYKLDTHWNAYGAKYALDDFVEQLSLPQNSFALTEHRSNWGDMLLTLAVESVGSDSLIVNIPTNEDCIVEKIPNTEHVILHNENGLPFICFGDSFSVLLQDFFTHYFDGPMYRDFDVTKIPDGSFPRYVIVECVERNILYAINLCEKTLNSSK